MDTKAKQRIVVTGGCGFIGRPLTRLLLAAGYEVVIVDDLSKGKPIPEMPTGAASATFFRGSILDRTFLSEVVARARPVAVVHLAAVHFIPECEGAPDRCLQVNVVGTHNVLRAAAALPTLPLFVLASTAAVYAPSVKAHTEGDLLEPLDIYGVSKLCCEHLVRLFHAQVGLPAFVARLFNVYGPDETSPHLVPSLIAQALRSPHHVLVGDLNTRRDYVYVDDVSRAIAAMLRRGRGMGLATCNVGSGRDMSGHEVLDALAKTLRVNLQAVQDSTRARTVDRPRLLADVGLLRGLAGWAPTTAFERGLAAAIRRPYAAGVVPADLGGPPP